MANEKDQLIFDEGIRLFPYPCSEGYLTVGVGRNLQSTGIDDQELAYLLYNNPERKQRFEPYKDESKFDLFRHLLDDMEKYGITEDEAYFLFDRDYNRVVSSLHGKFPWYDNQPKEVQNILINMAFNLGLNRLSRFKKTIKFITEKKYAQAAVEMLDSKWANQVGDRAIRLSERMKRCR